MATTPSLWIDLDEINETLAGTQNSVAVTSGVSNFSGTVFAWEQAGTIYARAYDNNGVPVSDEEILFQGAGSNPSLATLPNGEFVFSYQIEFASDFDVNVQRYSFDVATNSFNLISGFSVEASSTITTFDPHVATFDDGSFVFTYTKAPAADLTNPDIKAVIVNAAGVASAEIDIFDDANVAGNSRVATLSNGNFVVVWQDLFTTSTTDFGVSYSVRDGTTGAAVGGGITAQTLVFAEQNPDIVALKGGGFVITYEDEAGDSNGPGIRATVYDNAGNPVMGAVDFQVNTFVTGFQIVPEVVALNDGDFVITWLNAPFEEITGQRFDADGQKVGSEFTAGDVGGHDLALTDDGRIVVAYDSNTNSGDVGGQIYDPREQRIKGDAEDNIIAARLEGGAVLAGSGNDVVRGFNGRDGILGLDGNDFLRGGGGNDFLVGGNGNDRILGETGADRLFGQNGRDVMNGGSGNDFGRGGSGNDIIADGSGRDKFFGDGGNDLFLGGTGNDVWNGGTGIDTLRVSGSKSDFQITTVSSIVVRLTDTNFADGNQGSDLLAFVERIQYDDGITFL